MYFTSDETAKELEKENIKGCGKFIYHHVGKGNVYCQEAYLCKKCSQKTSEAKK